MPEYIESKSILSRLKDAPDPYFGITYSMNLYRGCQHQCIYCDSRSKVYGVGDLANIRIKKNALGLLVKALTRNLIKATIGTGSMNDPYMPIEKSEELTRKALEKIAIRHFPVHIITKSDLVIRDIDIIKDIGKLYAAVSVTITTADDELSKKIEPGATVSSKRFKALEQLAKLKIYSGIVLTPVLPYLTDNEENIRGIVQRAKDAGVSYIICWMGITQREGQREYFHSKLDEHFPGIRQKYEQQFGNNYECAANDSERLYNKYLELMLKLNIPTQMEHFTDRKPVQLDLFE